MFHSRHQLREKLEKAEGGQLKRELEVAVQYIDTDFADTVTKLKGALRDGEIAFRDI